MMRPRFGARLLSQTAIFVVLAPGAARLNSWLFPGCSILVHIGSLRSRFHSRLHVDYIPISVVVLVMRSLLRPRLTMSKNRSLAGEPIVFDLNGLIQKRQCIGAQTAEEI